MAEATDFPIVFDFEDNPVRTVDRDGEAWFVAADVCRTLEYSNVSQAVEKLDEDERGICLVYTPSGEQEMLVANESGIYNLILRSRKPQAKRFRKWVTSEVLPTIRKTGSYNQPRNVPRLSTLTRNSLTLLQALKKETNPAARQYIHEQLTITSRMMGIQPPPIDEIGQDEPEVPPLVDEFWNVYEALTTGPGAVQLNHSSRSDLIAVNLIEVCKAAKDQKLDMPSRMELTRTLRLSKNPRFIESNKTVNSVQDKSVRCWVFQNVTDVDQN